ncbi:hypothetical protein [Sphingomonas morindae]|uniref:Uncharacterized protein n=1 Tax=Sphingomonas morindae TaxID=1541170 RepID=A0ABY4XAR0_9SPHN|nr:hypothetical protein [Sphingomonas morindae]USI73775.1 hypothetical protein LHA26_04715 [Sphingomonas morindae]
MDLDALLRHYFGTDDPDAIDGVRLALGRERLTVDFGREADPGRRFALWTLMEVFGIAPLPAEAFPDHPALRRAADDYLDAADRLAEQDEADDADEAGLHGGGGGA